MKDKQVFATDTLDSTEVMTVLGEMEVEQVTDLGMASITVGVHPERGRVAVVNSAGTKHAVMSMNK